MKKMGILILLVGTQLYAAKDPLVTPIKMSAEEILSMPEINRQFIAKKQPEKIYEELLVLAKNPKKNIGVRWKALTLAAHLDPDQAQTDLKPFLKSEEWYMRNAALVGLTMKPNAEAHLVAMSMIKDKALVIRSAAVMALQPSKLNAIETRETLWGELNESYNFRQKQSLWVRAQILSQLALNPEKRELPLFIDALKEKDSRMYRPAIAALEKISDQKIGNAKADVNSQKKLWLQWAQSQKAQALR